LFDAFEKRRVPSLSWQNDRFPAAETNARKAVSFRFVSFRFVSFAPHRVRDDIVHRHERTPAVLEGGRDIICALGRNHRLSFDVACTQQTEVSF
jgi:hypothetical protein